MTKNISNLGTVLQATEQKNITGGKFASGGYGTVTCADGTTFSAAASSYESVVTNGNRWCLDHGHGGGSTYIYSELQ